MSPAFFGNRKFFVRCEIRFFRKSWRGKPADDPVRIWVPGCSSGEEAYSIAICLLENLGDRAASTSIQIFASDISEQARR